MKTREEAFALVCTHINNKNLIKHMLATEAIMSSLAKHFGEDEQLWGIAGLVHDVDYMQTEKEPEKHADVGANLLENLGYPAELVQAVRSHNPMNGSQKQSTFDECLYTADPLTGLIVACALIHPDKKLSSIDTPFIISRFKEKRFAAGANRDQIQNCEKLGLSLEEFIQLGLNAMQGISRELGL